MSRETGTKVDVLNMAIDKLNESRHVIYKSATAIEEQLMATVNWKGADADSMRKAIFNAMSEVRNSAAWMNEVTYQLILISKRLEQKSVERSSAFNNVS